MLKGLQDAGINLTGADLIVGTSAGAVLGSQIQSGRTLDDLYTSLWTLSPGSSGAEIGFDPAYLGQTLQMVNGAADINPMFRAEIGERALAAPKAYSLSRQQQFIEADLGGGVHIWPNQPLKIAAADVSDGSLRFFDATQGVPIGSALAASTALPGRVAPVAIGDRSYMDGFIGGPCPVGCWPNLDGAGGYGIIVVLTTGTSTQVARQIESFREQGSSVVDLFPNAEAVAARGPDPFDLEHLQPAAEAGRRQAASEAATVLGVWRGNSTPIR
jgi:NTE family protein